MRIARLELLRYGLFSDHSIQLPRAALDFHVLVGPNEAGKSTVRSAILDLLFGMETRSPYNFRHAHSEMRLAALLEHEGGSLDFHRIKARTRTLLAPDGAVLADSALEPFLGATDRQFFDQMFGLDHEKLVAGGNEILSASNDIGQILFQSASGIGSLGAVRDALEAEADGLWARRKSADRTYYQASDELARADAALKQATVRTKDWVAARDALLRVEAQLAQSQANYRSLEENRIRLERIRRVAGGLHTLRDKQQALAALGEVVVLPPDAGRQLADAELELAKAAQERALFAEQSAVAATRLSGMQPDERLLGAAADVQALADSRQQVRNHESDIAKRQLEIDGHWRAVEALVRQLGWPAEDKAQLESRLPGVPLRTAIAGLLKRHGVLEQALSVAEQAVRDKDIELAAIDAQINALPSAGVSDSLPSNMPATLRSNMSASLRSNMPATLRSNMSAPLRSALDAARGLGDTVALEKRLKAALAKAERELKLAEAGLGKWPLAQEVLRRIDMASAAEVDALQTRLAALDGAAVAGAGRLAELRASIGGMELEIAQYRAAHAPVTLDDLMEARASRDTLWQAMRSGEVLLAQAASDYEIKVRSADGVSDRRHDKAQAVSELQAKLDSLQRFRQQAAEQALRSAENDTARAALNSAWAARAAAMGVSGMPLLATGAWREAREKVLRAAEAVADARLALDELARNAAQARAALVAALGDEPAVADAALDLAALIIAAADALEAASSARVLHAALEKQRQAATLARAVAEDKARAAATALDAWRASWRDNLALAGLDAGAAVGAAEGALELFSSIEAGLAAMDALRRERIEAMQRDLDRFARDARSLSAAVAPDLSGQAPVAVAAELAARLARAKSERDEQGRLERERAMQMEQAATAQARVDLARAGLQPLLHLAGVSANDELRAAIARSEAWRALNEALTAARQAVEDGGDGLPLAALEAEWQAADLQEIPVVLADIARDTQALLLEQNALSAERANALAALSGIAGQDEAARAESMRQDALAKMANAAERYIRVHTAARLLRWAIDRYRETRQGPMLARAGAIFSGLTLGSFRKLAVDFESEPPALQGERSDGSLVGVEGMSDGTRDQLYLALRLAALELHLGQAQPLPFIADDLFVNYDDARARAGLEALRDLSADTQVLFLSHHDHLLPAVQAVFGKAVNIVRL
ncbi:MAG: hypothetical protein EXR27_17290 [Betaproteobacteria bacterium]|nr:hypothetical protein [Betaproteobacteria bacterium]